MFGKEGVKFLNGDIILSSFFFFFNSVRVWQKSTHFCQSILDFMSLYTVKWQTEYFLCIDAGKKVQAIFLYENDYTSPQAVAQVQVYNHSSTLLLFFGTCLHAYLLDKLGNVQDPFGYLSPFYILLKKFPVIYQVACHIQN